MLNFETLLREEAARFGLSSADLLGPSRKRKVVAARCAAMRRVWSETTLSLPAIGRLFGRDHTTVLHMLRKPKNWRWGDGTEEWSVGSLGRISAPTSPAARTADGAGEAWSSPIIAAAREALARGKEAQSNSANVVRR